VRSGPDQLSIEVRDDGVGFAADPTLYPGGTRGFGLWSISDRVRRASGDLRIETEPGGGCTARVFLPLAEDRGTGTHGS
jgi:signal transduction histidine kinase